MIVYLNGKAVKLPDFLIVGAARSGTTSLYYYLLQNPQIFMSSVKEPYFFCLKEEASQNLDSLYRKDIIWRLEEYVKLFEAADDKQIIGEATASYLYLFSDTIKKIKLVYEERYKDLKIIAILRNPIERAFSHYLYFVSRGKETLPFKEAIDLRTVEKRRVNSFTNDYLGYGMYYKQLNAYMEEFPNIKVFLLEDMRDTRSLMSDLFGFLGVDPDIEIDMNIKFNPSGIPTNRALMYFLGNKNLFQDMIRQSLKLIISEKYFIQLVGFKHNLLRKFLKKQEMDFATKEKLIDIFRDEVVDLQRLIKRDLSHWLEAKNDFR